MVIQHQISDYKFNFIKQNLDKFRVVIKYLTFVTEILLRNKSYSINLNLKSVKNFLS
jgi:hypothetical protein